VVGNLRASGSGREIGHGSVRLGRFLLDIFELFAVDVRFRPSPEDGDDLAGDQTGTGGDDDSDDNRGQLGAEIDAGDDEGGKAAEDAGQAGSMGTTGRRVVLRCAVMASSLKAIKFDAAITL